MRIDPALKVELCASKGSARLALNYGFVEDGRLTTCNGFVLASVPVEDAPQGVALVDLRAVKDARKKGQGPGFQPTKADNGQDYGPVQDVQFPNTKQIYPTKGRKQQTIALDAGLLYDLARAIGVEGRGVKITFEVDEKGRPLHSVFEVTAIGGADAKKGGYGLIMPCRW
jgi:hypothetical protein